MYKNVCVGVLVEFTVCSKACVYTVFKETSYNKKAHL